MNVYAWLFDISLLLPLALDVNLPVWGTSTISILILYEAEAWYLTLSPSYDKLLTSLEPLFWSIGMFSSDF